MTFFDDLYQKLFPAKKQSPKLVHEVINRSDQYLIDYAAWFGSDRMRAQLQAIISGYEAKLLKNTSFYDVHLLHSSYANGFALSYNQDIGKKDFQFLFDYFSERIQELPYKIANSDVMISEKADFIETKEKHYLKPKINTVEPPIDQQFGNILIEHILVDDKPSYLKLVASVYSDSLYQKPLTFEDLFKHIFRL